MFLSYFLFTLYTMKLEIDTKQRIRTGFNFILEFYKILMGTFLIAFVPQKCGEGVCTLRENIQNTEPLHLTGNIVNFATFMTVLVLYKCELQRENWCIEYLDIDHDKPTNNLDGEIEYYPEYKIRMKELNKNYLLSVYVSTSMLLCNFTLSSVVIGYDYAGINTLTSLLSFFILVVTKISNAYTIGKKSVVEEHALSAYLKTAKTYNTIDIDYKKDDIEVIEMDDETNNDKII